MSGRCVSCYGTGLVAVLLTVAFCMADSEPKSNLLGLKSLVKRHTTTRIVCPGYSANFQNPEDCSSFYHCNDNLVRLVRCGAGRIFSLTFQNCGDYPVPVGCSPPVTRQDVDPPTTSYVCPGPDGNFPDSSDCSRYYQCTNWQAQRRVCGTGLVFDPNAEGCSRIHDPEGCHRTDISPSPTNPPSRQPGQYQCPKSHGEFHDTTDCSRYYVCTNWQYSREQCPPSQFFDPHQKICSSAVEPTGCHVLSDGQIIGPFQCPASFGNYQDPADCSRYWSCTNFQATNVPCPADELFDTSTFRCNRISFVPDCEMPYNWNPAGVDFRCNSLFGNYQDTRDCSRYWRCNNGQATNLACPANQLFDTATRFCSDQINFAIGCTMPPNWNPNPSRFSCHTDSGSYQDSSDCSRYWRCINRQGTNLPCPPDQLFDPASAFCRGDIDIVPGCIMPDNWNPNPNGFTCRTLYGNYQDATDCSRYWRCTNGQASNEACPDDQLFDTSTRFCSGNIDSVSGCTMPTRVPGAGTKAPAEELKCPPSGPATNIPNPRICNAFYICGDGRLYKPCIFCGEGTYYDPTTMVCISSAGIDMAATCPGKVMMPHANKTAAQADGTC